jgi:hypothetical protein
MHVFMCLIDLTRDASVSTQVTFREPESAREAVRNPNPTIGGRRANCNIASMGPPRPSPSRGEQINPMNPQNQINASLSITCQNKARACAWQQ